MLLCDGFPCKLTKVRSVDLWNRVCANEKTGGEDIGIAFDVCVVGDVILFVYDWLFWRAVTCGNVTRFVRDDESDTAGFVILMAEKDDRAILDDASESLEIGGWQHIDRHDRNATAPKILKKVIERERWLIPENLFPPRKCVRWRDNGRLT